MLKKVAEDRLLGWAVGVGRGVHSIWPPEQVASKQLDLLPTSDLGPDVGHGNRFESLVLLRKFIVPQSDRMPLRQTDGKGLHWERSEQLRYRAIRGTF